MSSTNFQVIEGGMVKAKVVPFAKIDNAAHRRLFNGARLSTLSWEIGVRQEVIADRENEIMYDRGYRDGVAAASGKLRPPMSNPPAMAKREAA